MYLKWKWEIPIPFTNKSTFIERLSQSCILSQVINPKEIRWKFKGDYVWKFNSFKNSDYDQHFSKS